MMVKKLMLDELNRLGKNEFQTFPKIPVVVVLDNIRSGMNVGSVFRTCDAFAIEKIYITGISATPPHKEIMKAAIGANETVDWEYFQSTIEAIRSLKSKGYHCVGIEQTNESIEMQKFSYAYPLAIVLGNEVSGVSEDILELLDSFIEIPQYGTKHSLNVSVCAGIVLWEVVKDYKKI